MHFHLLCSHSFEEDDPVAGKTSADAISVPFDRVIIAGRKPDHGPINTRLSSYSVPLHIACKSAYKCFSERASAINIYKLFGHHIQWAVSIRLEKGCWRCYNDILIQGSESVAVVIKFTVCGV